jgi:hypothetical protein
VTAWGYKLLTHSFIYLLLLAHYLVYTPQGHSSVLFRRHPTICRHRSQPSQRNGQVHRSMDVEMLVRENKPPAVPDLHPRRRVAPIHVVHVSGLLPRRMDLSAQRHQRFGTALVHPETTSKVGAIQKQVEQAGKHCHL